MFVLLTGCEQKEKAQMSKRFGIPEKIKKKQVSKWEASKALLLRSGKQSAVAINAKRTNYELSDGSDHFTTPVTAFSDSESGNIWVGPEQSGYLEIENKILGFFVIQYRIMWTESILDRDSKSTLPDITKITNRFEQDVTGGSFYLGMHRANKRRTNLLDINKDSIVFGNGYGSSGGPRPMVSGFQWDKDLLKLSLTDPEKMHEAILWIDVKSREVKKTEEKLTKLGEKLYQAINAPKGK
ncbi:MAG: hypothetical protein CME33_20765 [Gimesia sp.]|uniref:hypothetical protein n=1 Tax=Gimesia sp. TaxID=2024833 RepID=UPI000C6AFCE7|nr:hypothetical protein [Gimesia sp.]MAX38987.1 hypothetical protein [Gimesia sp.]|tara:strand:+ start:436 stop:1155 length:720 start_codon:yes stop_codon:yes gene_type:complete